MAEKEAREGRERQGRERIIQAGRKGPVTLFGSQRGVPTLGSAAGAA